MELRYQMTDILPLLPIPQPPHGRSAYNIPCPLCDRPGTREKHLNTAPHIQQRVRCVYGEPHRQTRP